MAPLSPLPLRERRPWLINHGIPKIALFGLGHTHESRVLVAEVQGFGIVDPVLKWTPSLHPISRPGSMIVGKITSDGILVLTATTTTEAYALRMWYAVYPPAGEPPHPVSVLQVSQEPVPGDDGPF
jgi:hypothetical protein